MMLVVADSSPFIGLLKIGYIDILPLLYGSVVIPPEVAAELAANKRPGIVRQFVGARPAWLKVQAPKLVEFIPLLDPGESAAISLAREIKADLLLIDERDGREAAIARNIRTLRTTALLLTAARAGVLPDLKDAFDKLKATNFRVSVKVLDELLRLYKDERKP